MRKLFVVSLLFLSACGKFEIPKDPRTIHGVNAEFIPYINLYLSAKHAPLAYEISMGFEPLDGSVVGVCTRWHNSNFRQIRIDETYWRSATENMRRGLIAHELAHCDINRNHDESFLSNGWYKSLMYPINFDYPYGLEAYYFYELFNPSTVVTFSKAHDHDCVEDLEVE